MYLEYSDNTALIYLMVYLGLTNWRRGNCRSATYYMRTINCLYECMSMCTSQYKQENNFYIQFITQITFKYDKKNTINTFKLNIICCSYSNWGQVLTTKNISCLFYVIVLYNEIYST